MNRYVADEWKLDDVEYSLEATYDGDDECWYSLQWEEDGVKHRTYATRVIAERLEFWREKYKHMATELGLE